MSKSPNEIENLFRQAQAGEPVVQEFAGFWLETFRRDTQTILEWHRREGRTLALMGEDPESVRQQVEERLDAARQQLHGRLTRMITWAKESGRLQG